MEKKDLHIHTVYSDGANTPEEMVKSAIERGMSMIGFSDHSYTSFDMSYCMKKDMICKYRREIRMLKEKYRNDITVLCGIEQDYYSDEKNDKYDYVIGSVHYIKCGDEYVPVDEDAQTLITASEKYFNGDIYSLAEAYYNIVSDVVSKTKADIIGHFDLISKFNEKMPLFDETDMRYVTAWQRAADKLLQTEAVFEINTGAISRGYTTVPYPSRNIIEYIKERGGRFIMSSDSHSRDTLCYKFGEYTEYTL